MLGEYFQNGMNYDYLMVENLSYKPLYLSLDSKRLEPASKYSDLIGTMSAVNCLYLCCYLLELKFAKSCYFKVFFRIYNQNYNS